MSGGAGFDLYEYFGTGVPNFGGAVLTVSVGTAALPGVAFSGDADTGLYWAAANTWGLSSGGTFNLKGSATLITAALPIGHADGTASAPGITFSGDLNTGVFRVGADTIGLTAGGTEYSRIKHDASVPTVLDYSAPRVSYRARAALADSSATLSDAQFRGGIVSMTPTATRTLTTRTAAQMVAAFPGCQVGSSYDLEVVNLAAAQVVALAGGSGVTVVGVANVDGTGTNLSGAGRFRLVFTNVTASSEAADLIRVG